MTLFPAAMGKYMKNPLITTKCAKRPRRELTTRTGMTHLLLFFFSVGDLNVGARTPIFSITISFARASACRRRTNQLGKMFQIAGCDDVQRNIF